MRFVPTELPEVMLLEPQRHGDARGFFFESYRAEQFRSAGLPEHFVQDAFSRSCLGTVRGLHLQNPYGQGKLIAAVVGEILDVAVDVRVGSPSFGRWVSRRLSDQNLHRIFIPEGFAHGFAVLSEYALVSYRFTDYYHPEAELGIAWNDPELGIEWPFAEPILSPKDKDAAPLREHSRLPQFRAPTE
ncbi:MAG: dTDP-4-dehydrorhamnose 3,5-epimerase [Myxococcota bacterium]|jgi:dTDP-4-dehydrorhamnose 3,5-epimerase|nr:dTDP-4-dehydrorhamnose 3,5-epimerase [Myxococcota bacterium]